MASGYFCFTERTWAGIFIKMLNFVAHFDLKLRSRSRRTSSQRYLYLSMLIIETLLFYSVLYVADWPPSEQGSFLELYAWTLIFQHFLIVLLGSPVIFAGALSEDFAKGTMPMLMTTDTRSWIIVMGKFWSRLVQMLGLLTLPLPFLCLAHLNGYTITMDLILALVGMTLSLLFALGAWSFWVSIFHDQPRQAAQFMLIRVILLMGSWCVLTYWLLPLMSAYQASSAFLDALVSFLAWWLPCFDLHANFQASVNGRQEALTISTMMVMGTGLIVGIWYLARTILTLRQRTQTYLEKATQPTRLNFRQRFLRPALDEDDPIAWRERFVHHGWGRWLVTAGMLAVSWVISQWLLTLLEPWYFFLWSMVGGLVIGIFVVVRASGCISGERQKQTWDSLLLTPLDTWEILFDKRRGVIRAFRPVLFALAGPILFFAYGQNLNTFVHCTCAMFFIWGLMHYMASIGIYNSTVDGSWLSLISSVGLGLGFSVGLLILLTIMGLILMMCIFIPFFLFILRMIGMTTFSMHYWFAFSGFICCFMGWRLYHQGNIKLWQAQAWIDQEERYGRTLTRSLTLALRTHYRKREKTLITHQPVQMKDEELTPFPTAHSG